MTISDNGYSGANFERPAMIDLLNKVNNGEIACILTKDLSRFGRNALGVGYFLENVFPLYHTRFIAVTDNIDSNKFSNYDSILIPFKQAINEHYIRDISKKSTSARHTRMKNGEYRHSNTIYGYKFDKDKNIIIDEEVADNVRLIFNLAVNGKTNSEIKAELFKRNILTPAEYKATKGYFGHDISNSHNLWSNNTIRNTLSNEFYIGTYIARKTTTSNLKNIKNKPIPKEDWIRIPNSFEPIIDEKTFKKVQENRKTFKIYTPPTKLQYALRDKLYCGVCGHKLYRKPNKNSYFFCRFSNKIESFKCSEFKFIEKDLENLILKEVQDKVSEILYYSSLKTIKTAIKTDNELTRLQKKQKEIYEDFISLKISKSTYFKEKEIIDRKIENLSPIHKKSFEQNIELVNLENLITLAHQVQDTKKLTFEFVDAIIEKITINPEIEIEFKEISILKKLAELDIA